MTVSAASRKPSPTPAQEKPKRPMKFRLLVGQHSEGDIFDMEKGILKEAGPTYLQGDILESTTDLAARYNSPGSIKFERLLDDGTPIGSDSILSKKRDDESMKEFYMRMAAEEEQREAGLLPPEEKPADRKNPQNMMDELEAMTVAQLKAVCNAENIDFGGSKDKSTIINYIIDARNS